MRFPLPTRSVDPARGLLITLEQFACEETPGGRKTLIYPDWSVGQDQAPGGGRREADAVVPAGCLEAEVLAYQHDLVERVGRDCRAHDIAFLLEPLVYPLGGSAGGDSYHEDAGKRPEMVLATVEEFRKERYGIDIFKLETPITAKPRLSTPMTGSAGSGGDAGLVQPHRRAAWTGPG